MAEGTSIREFILLGAGNVASHLGPGLCSKGLKARAVFSRNRSRATELAQSLDAEYIGNLLPDAEFQGLVLCCLSDQGLAESIPQISYPSALVVHTSGSLPLSILDTCSPRTGVLYPFQTFSKNLPLPLEEIPFFVEARLSFDLPALESLARLFSNQVTPLDSEKRAFLQLCGVMVANFANHLWATGEGILAELGLPRKSMIPLLRQSLAKLESIPALEAQTGPASRHDRLVLERHLSMLESHPEIQELYRLISNRILQTHSKPGYPYEPL